MPRRVRFFILAVVVAAAVLCAALDWSFVTELGAADWAGLLTFLALALISQVLAVDSTIGSAKPVKSSIAFLPLLALAALFPPAAVVLAIAVTTITHELFFLPERLWYRATFNTSQAVLAAGLGSLVFRAIATLMGLPLELREAADIATLFMPFYALALTFFGANLLFVSLFVAIKKGASLNGILREAAGQGGGNLFYDLLASPVALFAAYLYQAFFVGGLLAVVLPLLLIRHSYLSAIQLEQANQDLLRVLVKAIETRDPYTSGHSLRVSTLAKLIAQDYGARVSAVNDIEKAALLHDIGKIDALYAEIISKPTSLTDQERAVIRTHATKGADLLQSLTSLNKNVIAGVRHHHERYDGGDYPDGLAGKAIPMAARVIMLCDSIDAMLSDRPYRSALPLSKVKSELERCSGSQFDPDIVKAIISHNTLERAELLVERAGARTPPVRAVVG
jgi:putative nucleotidyltransferase with HDIG domain